MGACSAKDKDDDGYPKSNMKPLKSNDSSKEI